MKLIKKKEVVTEEIELLTGTYYFVCTDGIYHKMVLTDYDEEGIDYFLESVENYNSPYGIRVRKDFIIDQEDIPYKFSAYIQEISGRKIEKQKQEVIKRLWKQEST